MPTEKELKEQSRVMLGRIDERTENMQEDIREIKECAIKQNGRIRKLEITLVGLVSILTGAGILDATVWNKVIGG